jgi:hypothetical protein
MMTEAETTNPIRLLVLVPKIRAALDEARALRPDDVQVRLDLVRFHMMTPSIMGGDEKEARTHAAEIARRDVALGHFAHGYIAYREKEYGPARHALREARRAGSPSTRTLATKWLGWLSQETQQWDEAFAMFEELGELYEIGRTAGFCGCRVERGKAALREHLKLKPKDADARKVLQKLERLGVR